jgi:hypothetical protein
MAAGRRCPSKHYNNCWPEEILDLLAIYIVFNYVQ